jgi:hypothetical protein
MTTPATSEIKNRVKGALFQPGIQDARMRKATDTHGDDLVHFPADPMLLNDETTEKNIHGLYL